jgi:hypothetical protein
LTDDRVLQVLLYLTVLLFVSAGVVPLARGHRSWARWARRGAIAVFSIAIAYAIFLTFRWGLVGGNR